MLSKILVFDHVYVLIFVCLAQLFFKWCAGVHLTVYFVILIDLLKSYKLVTTTQLTSLV